MTLTMIQKRWIDAGLGGGVDSSSSMSSGTKKTGHRTDTDTEARNLQGKNLHLDTNHPQD